MSKPGFLLAAALLLASALSSGAARDLDAELRKVPSGPAAEAKDPGFPGDGGYGFPGWGGGGGSGFPGWGGGGSGFPGGGWGNGGGGGGGSGNWGGGWGAGYGGPGGGYSRGGVVRPSVVCSERGPCYKKRLTCPAKCFYSYSHSGRNYGSGGGGGGCSLDCKKCVAYC